MMRTFGRPAKRSRKAEQIACSGWTSQSFSSMADFLSVNSQGNRRCTCWPRYQAVVSTVAWCRHPEHRPFRPSQGTDRPTVQALYRQETKKGSWMTRSLFRERLAAGMNVGFVKSCEMKLRDPELIS